MTNMSEALRLAQALNNRQECEDEAADELRRLSAVEDQRDALRERADTLQRWYDQQLDRLAAAEAQRDTLLEALRQIVGQHGQWNNGMWAANIASAAIAKAEGEQA